MRVASYWDHTFFPELVRPTGTVFDFGLNYGGFASLIAPLCKTVIGFEPDPYWDQNLDLPANVRRIPKALGAVRGTFHLSQNRQSFSSLHHADAGAKTVEVEAITLADALALEPSDRIDLVKMDIEGAEIGVLETAEPDQLRRIAQFTVEFHDFLDAADIPKIEAIIAKLEALGFWAVKFSWSSYGDMLFVNQKLEPLSSVQRVEIIALHKYGRGVTRMLKRKLRAAS